MKVNLFPFLFFLLTPTIWPWLDCGMYTGWTPVFSLPFGIFSLSNGFLTKKKKAKEIFLLFLGATPKEAVFDTDEGCIEKHLGEKKP